MLLEAGFVAIYALHAAVTLWSLAQLRRFLAQTPRITDEASLERYKDLVRTQMYLALVVMGMLAAGLVIGLMLIRRHGIVGFAVVLGINAWIFVLGMYHRSWELRARRLEAASEALAGEHRRVSDVWVKKPRPDF
jgi:hypothetical protein